jgi:hypothetical protein
MRVRVFIPLNIPSPWANQPLLSFECNDSTKLARAVLHGHFRWSTGPTCEGYSVFIRIIASPMPFLQHFWFPRDLVFPCFIRPAMFIIVAVYSENIIELGIGIMSKRE